MTDTSLRPTGLLLDLQEHAVGVRGDVHVRCDQETGELEVRIPANTTARVRSEGPERKIGPGRTVLRSA